MTLIKCKDHQLEFRKLNAHKLKSLILYFGGFPLCFVYVKQVK